MIPKTIHYCWFGGKPLPEDAQYYISTWKKFCPDYEIKEWNESNFDINCCDYVKEAYQAKKWAFVSDYARFAILYKYGGVYFDTDVEVIKPLDDIIAKGSFMGLERMDLDFAANPGLGLAAAPGLGLAAAPGLGLYKEMLEFYKDRHFIQKDGSLDTTTVVQYTTNMLIGHGLKPSKNIQKVAGIYIYSVDYFCPKDIDTGELKITPNTYTIHHFAGSWLSPWRTFKKEVRLKLAALFGKEAVVAIKRLMK